MRRKKEQRNESTSLTRGTRASGASGRSSALGRPSGPRLIRQSPVARQAKRWDDEASPGISSQTPLSHRHLDLCSICDWVVLLRVSSPCRLLRRSSFDGPTVRLSVSCRLHKARRESVCARAHKHTHTQYRARLSLSGPCSTALQFDAARRRVQGDRLPRSGAALCAEDRLAS